MTFSNLSTYQIFPKFGPRGGPQISTFSRIQNSLNHPMGGRGGGGQESYGLFPHFRDIFSFDCFPNLTLKFI